jgi:hypothetical protein
MKTSELIKALQELITKQKDREIYIYNPKTREYEGISIISHNMLSEKESFFSLEPKEQEFQRNSYSTKSQSGSLSMLLRAIIATE